MSMSALSDELAQVRTKKKEFLAQIERIVPWKEWLVLIQPCYYKGERGNKPYPLETMLRLYLLQNLYDLSDEATAAEAIDSRAFSDFCGVDSSNQVPDGDTIGRFRNLLVKNGLQEKLFALSQEQGEEAGFGCASGQERQHLALWLQSAYRCRQGQWPGSYNSGDRRQCSRCVTDRVSADRRGRIRLR